MKIRYVALAVLALTAVAEIPGTPLRGVAAAQTSVQPREGWYKSLVDYGYMRDQVQIPPKKDVFIVDSRPAARQYDPGHIPGAVNIPDTQFEKLLDKLPENKAALLLFYCGGVDCILSHNSAAKAEKLGYANIKVYPGGLPDWKANGGQISVSAAYLKKLIDEKASYVLIDARPKRVADKGMIPTAVNVSDTDFDKHLDKLPADKSVALIYYCGGLECVLSDKSAEKARALGYANVFTYPPGYPEWEKLHGAATPAAVALSAAAPAAAALAPGKEKGSVTVASFEAVWKASPASVLLVDVRDPKEFAAGTIKGAINVPINELQKRIGELATGKPVVFVCGTGARAGEAYDMTALLDSKLPIHFLDANVKFAADGSFSMTQK